MPQELVIVLIAACAALAGSLLGSWLTRTTERKQWVRNQRLEVYKEIEIASGDLERAFSRGLTAKDGESPDLITAVTKFERIPISLFASESVADAYTELLDAVMTLSGSSQVRGTSAYREVTSSANAAVDKLRNKMRRNVQIMP
jgi:hypothetical protein